jgi:hypothetical protein
LVGEHGGDRVRAWERSVVEQCDQRRAGDSAAGLLARRSTSNAFCFATRPLSVTVQEITVGR